jgi:4-amino-4-deoxy-L-arabinose transferase-like glycosyltransferase
LWDLGGHALNPDETLWIERGSKLIYPLRQRQFMQATAHLGHPGVVPAVLIGSSYVYLGRGVSEFSFDLLDPVTAARFPIALVGVTTCLLLYLIGRISLGEAPSFWGAIFLALYPSHIALSRVAHIDTTLTLFSMLTILCYLAHFARERPAWKIASAVFFGLAMLTKSPAIILPLIIAAWKACVRLRDRRCNLHFWELSDLGWLGLGLAVYFSLFTRLWAEPSQLQWRLYLSSSPFAQAAIRAVAKAASVPWLQILGVVLCAYFLFAGARGGRQSLRRRPPAPVSAMLVFLLCLSFIQVFRRPITDELLLGSKTYYIADAGHLKYWMGMVVNRPPRWFYLFMIAVSTPPFPLVMMIFGAILAVRAFIWKRGIWAPPLMCLVAPVVFTGIMSMTHKMGYRYIDPILPFLCLLSGAAVSTVISCCTSFATPAGATRARNVINGLCALIVAVSAAVVFKDIAPFYDLYANAFVGGPAGATRYISLGWGAGTKAAIRYLKANAREEDSVSTLGLALEFRYHWAHDPPTPPVDVLIDRTKPPHVDWLVIPLMNRMRGLEKTTLEFSKTLPRVYSVTRCGVDLMDVYRCRDEPLSTPTAYHAEDLVTPFGKLDTDSRVSGGPVVMGDPKSGRGMLLAGPYLRYAPGCWKAVFILRAETAPEDTLLGRILVTGALSRDILASRDLRARDFGKKGDYTEFSLPFCIERPRRLQFLVDFAGAARLWVDRIDVRPRSSLFGAR